jgi:quercetin dioxygenase-like cupin family protein
MTDAHTLPSRMTAKTSPAHKPKRKPKSQPGVDLIGESRSLLAEARSTNAAAVKKVVGLSHLEAILSTVAAGASSEEHSDSGPITIQTIIGRVRIGLDKERIVLGAGSFMALDAHVRHTHKGLEDSVVLITFAWPNSQSGRFRWPEGE